MTQWLEALSNYGTPLVFTALGFALIWRIAGKWTRKGGYLDQQNDMLDTKVKAIDNHLYELEHSALRLGVTLPGLELQFWPPEQARENFLEAFHKLFPEKVW